MAYIFDSNLSYSDYLQARDFLNQDKVAVREASDRGARTVSMAISGETRRLIASQETLAREGFQLQRETAQAQLEAQREMNATLKEGFECLSYELAAISDGISELNATFHWGFSQMIAQMGRMNDTLDQLHAIAKTPVQTVAFNHFEIARDAYRQGLYAETIEELDKAIGGDHTSPGYKLEWRFHQLRGVVRLGSFESGPAPVNLPEAEESFLAAARYAQKDYPPDAARALLSAGWAAYCQGKMPEALAHTEQAMQLDPGLSEALFQASKVHMAMDQPQRALPLLGKLVKAQTFYAIKAAGDGDFQRYDSELREYLEALRQERLGQLAPAAAKIVKLLEEGKHLSHQGVEAVASEIVRSGCNVPLMDLEELARTIESQGIAVFENLDIIYNDEQSISEVEHYTERVMVKPAGLFKRAEYHDEPKTRTIVRNLSVKRTATVERLSLGPLFGQPILTMDFLRIPAGEFIMGDDRDQDSKPHQIQLTKGFLLGRYPVTQAQWRGIMGNNPSGFLGDERPVESVSWDDAQAFIARLNEYEGRSHFRLPTEAEWEYACRAGNTGFFCFVAGEARLGDYAWYEENSGSQTHSVGQKKPNALGLHDMHGNVAEWCQDWYADYPGGPQTDPQGPSMSQGGVLRGLAGELAETLTTASAGPCRVLRGGSYNASTEDCRSAARNAISPTWQASSVGFRLVRTI